MAVMSSNARRRLRWVAVVLVALLAAGAGAAWWTWRPASEEEAQRLARRLDIGPGSIVGEIGVGGGTLALALARQVGPSGRLYANEISTARLDDLRDASARQGIDWIVLVEGDVDRANLPDGCCDVVFMRHVYHHFAADAVAPMLASLHAALRPGGILAIIDFPPSRLLELLSSGPRHPSRERQGHGVTIEAVVREVGASGFEHRDTVERWAGSSFLVVFARRPGLDALRAIRLRRHSPLATLAGPGSNMSGRSWDHASRPLRISCQPGALRRGRLAVNSPCAMIRRARSAPTNDT
jgi:SAM-dependent methyltransferase